MVTGVVPHPIPSTVTLAPSGIDVITSDVTAGGVTTGGVRTPDVWTGTGSGSTIGESVTGADAGAVDVSATDTVRSTTGRVGGCVNRLLDAGWTREAARARDGLGLNQTLTIRMIRTPDATGNAK